MSNMEKERSINFAAVHAAVESGLKKLESDPARGVRNMLDLGDYFSHTRRQRVFFQTAQKMLGRKRSQYMLLVRRMVAGVDHDVLKTVGINMGYVSWSHGARIIRDIEATRGFNVPWSFVFNLDLPCPDPMGTSEMRGIIEQARTLGAHCFWFNTGDSYESMPELLDIFGEFHDCAFILLLPPDKVSREFAQAALKQRNTVICVKYGAGDDIERAAGLLKEARLLFGLGYIYDDANSEKITNGDLLDTVDKCAGQYALFLYSDNCSAECKKRVHQYASGEKTTPEKPAFMIDFFDDIAIIDRNISTQPCYIEIRAGGETVATPWGKASGINIRGDSLSDVLLKLAPRQPE